MTAMQSTDAPSRPRGRPAAFDREAALQQALLVFWSHGYEGASMAELTTAMNMNKPSIYAAFGNKEELFRHALHAYTARTGSFIGKALEATSARQVVDQLLNAAAVMLTDASHPPGCMIVQTALACGAACTEIREELTSYRQRMRQLLQQRFERAHAEGDLPADAVPADLARYVAAIHQGMSVQASSGANHEELQALVRVVLQQWPSA